MAPSIRVDEEVYERLKKMAEPFVDTPNTVLRRVFKLDDRGDADHRPARARRSGDRLAPGSLLHQREYRLPILTALADRGGRARAREVINAVGEALRDRLSDVDRSRNKTGGVRWINRTMWVRARLVREGLLRNDSEKGTWELTDEGWAYLKRGRG